MALALPCGIYVPAIQYGRHSGTARQESGQAINGAECALAVAVSAAALDLIRRLAEDPGVHIPDRCCLLRWPSWGRRTQAGGHPRRRNACGLVQNTEYMPFGKGPPGNNFASALSSNARRCWSEWEKHAGTIAPNEARGQSSPYGTVMTMNRPATRASSTRTLSKIPGGRCSTLRCSAPRRTRHLGMAACWQSTKHPLAPPATRLAKLVSRVNNVETVTESERHQPVPHPHPGSTYSPTEGEHRPGELSFDIDVFKAVPVKSSGIRIKLCVGSCPTWTARRQRSFHEVTDRSPRRTDRTNGAWQAFAGVNFETWHFENIVTLMAGPV